eukprot:scaffold129172_cov18-Tisochrysis_lutea.AAC.2
MDEVLDPWSFLTSSHTWSIVLQHTIEQRDKMKMDAFAAERNTHRQEHHEESQLTQASLLRANSTHWNKGADI